LFKKKNKKKCVVNGPFVFFFIQIN